MVVGKYRKEVVGLVALGFLSPLLLAKISFREEFFQNSSRKNKLTLSVGGGAAGEVYTGGKGPKGKDKPVSLASGKCVEESLDIVPFVPSSKQNVSADVLPNFQEQLEEKRDIDLASPANPIGRNIPSSDASSSFETPTDFTSHEPSRSTGCTGSDSDASVSSRKGIYSENPNSLNSVQSSSASVLPHYSSTASAVAARGSVPASTVLSSSTGGSSSRSSLSLSSSGSAPSSSSASVASPAAPVANGGSSLSSSLAHSSSGSSASTRVASAFSSLDEGSSSLASSFQEVVTTVEELETVESSPVVLAVSLSTSGGSISSSLSPSSSASSASTLAASKSSSGSEEPQVVFTTAAEGTEGFSSSSDDDFCVYTLLGKGGTYIYETFKSVFARKATTGNPAVSSSNEEISASGDGDFFARSQSPENKADSSDVETSTPRGEDEEIVHAQAVVSEDKSEVGEMPRCSGSRWVEADPFSGIWEKCDLGY